MQLIDLYLHIKVNIFYHLEENVPLMFEDVNGILSPPDDAAQ